ncbi:hypothetical protein [Pseudophaeobacter arcticus]|uniref:hypothetical protein n=1 Tax=Pseudophaeobacter arcticus TaxID=385492 RepID=UPI00249006A3|nr:hypothetical protein [Pseudophaeobacter arcticus]
MKNTLLALGLTAALVAPLTAEAFTTPDGVRINPVNDLIFEVIPQSSGSFSEFWCGASEYARRVKGAQWLDTIYVVQGRGTSVTTGRRSAVQFTLSPEQVGVSPPPQGWLALGIKPGNRMSVQQARSYCDRSPVRL